LVLLDAGRIAGYALGSPYKARAAYRWACEVSVYLELGRRRTGAGRMLYNELFTRLAERGFRNRRGYDAASVGLHRAMGFEPAGRGVAVAASDRFDANVDMSRLIPADHAVFAGGTDELL
jgi:L-amino acid N-acyltransferase YncA